MSFYEERKKEHFYKQAKKEGYRARSAYKLKQLQKKFYIIKRGDYVIDLGAAPGGWLQVASEFVGAKGKVIGVDKEAIMPFNKDNIVTFRVDMRSKELTNLLLEEIQSERVDVVLSDLAGNVTGNWTLDSDRQIFLAELAFNTCKRVLKDGGTFVTKIFRGGAIQEFDQLIKPYFQKIKRFRPPATRKQSAEEYYICKGFRVLEEEE